MLDSTKTYYQQKVSDVLNYVHNNIDGDLSIKSLAEQFNISFFHFHRIMRASLNEPLGSYIDRIRLDTAVKLIRYSDEPLKEIALRIGYNDLSSFTKAFSKEFGLSPLDFRSDKNLVLGTHIDYQLNDPKTLIRNIKPRIIILPDKKVLFVRLFGRYGSEETYKAWAELSEFVLKNKLTGWKPEYYAIYYDDPEVTGIDKCTSDLCIVSKREIKGEGRIESQIIPGGKFVVFRYKGPYDYLWELYNTIYNDWLLSTEFKLRDSPSMEKYLYYSDKSKPENYLTEIYVPIE